MNKVSTKKLTVRQRIVASVLAVTFLLPMGAVAANAYNVYKYQYTRDGFGQCQAFEYRDYNWAEEVFGRKKDGIVYIGRAPSYMCR